jgi:hypothetical protein
MQMEVDRHQNTTRARKRKPCIAKAVAHRFVIEPSVMLSGIFRLLVIGRALLIPSADRQERADRRTTASGWLDSLDERTLFWIGYAALLPLYLLPLLVTRFLPGLDLPLHLSLVDAVAKSMTEGTPQHALYEAHFSPSGYFAYYFLLYQLGKLCSLQLAHRLIIGVTIAALPLACLRLSRALGIASFPSLLAFPLAYNMPLHYGFVSFACSIPIMVFFVAQTTVVLRAQRLIPIDIGLLSALGLLLYLCHVQTYGLSLVIACALCLVPGSLWSARVAVFLSILPSLIVLYMWQSKGIFSADLALSVAQAPRKGLWYSLQSFLHARLSELSSPSRLLIDPLYRLFLFQVHLLRGFTDFSDQVMSNVFLIALAVLIGLGHVVGRKHRQDVGTPFPPLALRLLPPLLALGAYLALPHHIAEFQTIYPRFAILSAVLSFSLIPPALRSVPRLLFRRLFVLCAAASLLYALLLTRNYYRYGRELADFATVLDATPSGGKAVGWVFGGGVSRVLSSGAQLANLPAYYSIERRSSHSMVAITFCGAPGSLCRKKSDAARIPLLDSFHPEHTPLGDAVAYFDYFITYAAPLDWRPLELQKDELAPLATAGLWTVYRKNPNVSMGPPKKE